MTDMPPTNPGLPSGAERRRFHRYTASRATCSYLLIPSLEAIVPLKVNNISAGGISLILDRMIEPGSLATVDLYNVVRDFPCKVEFRVAYALESRPGGPVVLGGPFARPLSAEEMCGLL
jgi:hypothetical protein